VRGLSASRARLPRSALLASGLPGKLRGKLRSVPVGRRKSACERPRETATAWTRGAAASRLPDKRPSDIAVRADGERTARERFNQARHDLEPTGMWLWGHCAVQ